MLKLFLALALISLAARAAPQSPFVPIPRGLGPYDKAKHLGQVKAMLAAKQCVLASKDEQLEPCSSGDDAKKTPYICEVTGGTETKAFKLKFVKPGKQFTLRLHAVEFNDQDATDEDFKIAAYIEEFCSQIKKDAESTVDTKIKTLIPTLVPGAIDGVQTKYSDTKDASSSDSIGSFQFTGQSISAVFVYVKGSSLSFKSYYGDNTVTLDINDEQFITTEATRVLQEALTQAKKVHDFIHTEQENQKTMKLHTFKCEDIAKFMEKILTTRNTNFSYTSVTLQQDRGVFGKIANTGILNPNVQYQLECQLRDDNMPIKLLHVQLKRLGIDENYKLEQAFLKNSFNSIQPLVESFALFLFEVFQAACITV